MTQVYDDEGRLTSQSGAWDALFYPSSLSWDQKNRATSITNNSGAVLHYAYDPMDFRIGSTGGGNGPVDYYLQGENLEAEYSAGVLQSKYLRGINTDELVAAFTNYQGHSLPSIFHQDAQLSVLDLSAHDGSNQQSNAYGPFGGLTVQSGPLLAQTNELLFTGRELDWDTQLYYYRARYYHPATGRFISEDPLGFSAGPNFYSYANNNPINGNDPSGQCPMCIGAGHQRVLAVPFVVSLVTTRADGT